MPRNSSLVPIGVTDKRTPVRVDVLRLVKTKLLVQANSGAGKSWCLRRLLEQTHGQLQHLVIDPEGEFSTLREKFDYVLAAKKGGDTIADPRSAKLLAERLLELGVSAVLDIYELKAHDRIRFVKLFVEALVDAPKKFWHPTLVVLDEAHVYCPEKASADSAGAVIDLATRGRKRGFCAVLATQRLAKLNKDAAAEANNKLIGRTSLDVDLKRAADELGFGKDSWPDLRNLKDGEFFAFGPAVSTQVVRVQIGGVRTTHPSAGARLASAAPPPTAKVKALLPKLADLPAEAEEKQRTNVELQRRVRQLERELAKKPTPAPAPAPPPPERVEVPVVKESHMKRLESLEKRVTSAVDALTKAYHALSAEVHGHINEMKTEKAREPIKPKPVMPQLKPSREWPKPAPPTEWNRDGELTEYEKSLLVAFAERYPIKVTRAQLSILAGRSHKSSSFDGALRSLREKELITANSDGMAITEEGFVAVGTERPQTPQTPDERIDMWRRRLKRYEVLILDALVDEYPETLSKVELSEKIGRSTRSSSFDLSVRNLRMAKLVTVDAGRLQASETLFT